MKKMMILLSLFFCFGAFASYSYAADESLVVKSINNKSFRFSEQESLDVQTFACKKSLNCVPVDVQVEQILDVFKVENPETGMYRFSKITNLPLVSNLVTTVTFTVQLNGNQQVVEKKIQANTMSPQVSKGKKNLRKSQTAKSRKYYAKVWKRQRQLRRQRIARANAKRARLLAIQRAKKTTKVVGTLTPRVEKKVIQPLPSTQNKVREFTPQKLPISVQGQTQSSKQTDTTKVLPAINQWSDEALWDNYSPVVTLLMIFAIGVLLRTSRQWVTSPTVMVAVHFVLFLVAFSTFLMVKPSTIKENYLLYGSCIFLGILVFTIQCLRLWLELKTLHANRFECHGPVYARRGRHADWYRKLRFHILDIARERFSDLFFPIDRRRQLVDSIQLKRVVFASIYTVGAAAVILIVVVSLRGQTPKIAPIQHKTLQVGVSHDRQVNTYQVVYSRNLFSEDNSFAIRRSQVKRPIVGDQYFHKKEWKLGEDVIDIARKYDVEIFTLGKNTIEIWSLCTLSASKLKDLALEISTAIAQAVHIPRFRLDSQTLASH